MKYHFRFSTCKLTWENILIIINGCMVSWNGFIRSIKLYRRHWFLVSHTNLIPCHLTWTPPICMPFLEASMIWLQHNSGQHINVRRLHHLVLSWMRPGRIYAIRRIDNGTTRNGKPWNMVGRSQWNAVMTDSVAPHVPHMCGCFHGSGQNVYEAKFSDGTTLPLNEM